MVEIYFTYKRVPETRLYEAVVQMENTVEDEPGRECAEVLCAIAGQEFVVIDFLNEVGPITDILSRLRVECFGGKSLISIRINPESDEPILKNILRLCGYTSQQFATGSENQINTYLQKNDRIILELTDLAPNLICVGQLECYKDMMIFITQLSPEVIMQRLRRLPYRMLF